MVHHHPEFSTGIEDKPRIPKRIFYAGESQRRKAFLKFCFPDITNYSFNIDPEPDIPNVFRIMKYKIQRLNNSAKLLEGDVIIAADTRTAINRLNQTTGEIEESSKGKPKSIKEVQNNFKEIVEASDKGVDPPYYTVKCASGCLYSDHEEEFFGVQDVCQIVLRKDAFSRLTTSEGFNDYLNTFQEFYSNPPYSTEKMKAVSPLNLSGGISLPVLTKMDMVDSVYGISRDGELFHEVLKHAIHLVAVGIAPDLMDVFGVEGNNAVKEWGWLNKVVDNALKDRI